MFMLNHVTPVTNGVVEYLVEATDDEHVLFGTDAPMRDPRQQLGWFCGQICR